MANVIAARHTVVEIADATGIALRTLNRRISAPETMTLAELIKIADYIGETPDGIVRKLLSPASAKQVTA